MGDKRFTLFKKEKVYDDPSLNDKKGATVFGNKTEERSKEGGVRLTSSIQGNTQIVVNR